MGTIIGNHQNLTTRMPVTCTPWRIHKIVGSFCLLFWGVRITGPSENGVQATELFDSRAYTC